MELSRRRSIKLKAQVDKLQENREGEGWSQHKDRVQFTTTQYYGIHPQSSGGLKKNSFPLIFIPGHRGSFVYSEAAAPADRARVQPDRAVRWGKPPGRRSGPAAERGPQIGNQPHQTGQSKQSSSALLFL